MTRTPAAVLVALLVFTRFAHAQTQPTTLPSEAPPSAPLPPGMTPIFDGKTLDGWVQEPPNAINISGGDITDAPALAKKLAEKADPVCTYVFDQLDDAGKATVAVTGEPNLKELRSVLSKNLTRIVTGPSIYDTARFKDVNLRPETVALRERDPQGRDLARLNRVLLEDAYPKELWTSPPVAWRVRNGILESLGAGRGVIHTKESFDRYRVIFDVRHVRGNPDHRAGVLVFCTPYEPGGRPVNDALGAIQFQVPNGGSWDYRIGKNNNGKGLFTRVQNPKYDEHEWSRCEILVDPKTGTARMAVAHPVGAKAVEVLNFNDPTAGQKGPFALQMHNRGLFDEYANIAVERSPQGDELITTK